MKTKGARFNPERQMKYFFKACFEGKLEIVKICYENGFDINCINRDGETPLFQAVRGESIGVCKYLHGIGALLDVSNVYGENLADKIFFSPNQLIRDYFSSDIRICQIKVNNERKSYPKIRIDESDIKVDIIYKPSKKLGEG